MRNKAITSRFYINKLGFQNFGTSDYDGYLMLQKDDTEIHFFEFKDLNPKENYGRIIVFPDGKIEHWINGWKVVEYQRGTQYFHALVAKSKYVVWSNFGMAEKGHILLQEHGTHVAFRSIKIKEL